MKIAEELFAEEGDYLIDSGVLLTNNLTGRQSGTEILNNASMRLASQYIEFTSAATLQETLALTTGLADKSIIAEGEGPLISPTLSLAGFPVDFASEKLSEVLGTSPETLSQLSGLDWWDRQLCKNSRQPIG